MAQALTKTTRLLSRKTGIEPNIILEIEGLSVIFGAQAIYRQPLFDEDPPLEFDDVLFFDTAVIDPDSRDYISLKKTSKNITQQVLVDKGSSSSVSRMNVELVDKDGEITKLLEFGNEIPDVLGARAKVFLNFVGGSHPEGSIRVFTGYIDEYSAQAGIITIGVTSSENLKRQKIFTQFQTEITAGIDDVVTTIPLAATIGLLPTQDAVTSYIQVEDELMEITSIGASYVDVVRGALTTTQVAHDISSEAISFYRMEGSPIDLALKMLMSNTGNTTYTNDSVELKNFAYIDSSLTLSNAIKFSNLDIENELNLIAGDFITTSGAANGANNGTFTITGFGIVDDGSYVLVDSAAFVVEIDTSSTIEFNSQYNTLATGCGLIPDEVDVAQHEKINTLFSTGFVDYDFYIRDTVDAKDFIDKELYRPMGLYSIMRNSRTSVNVTAPPLSADITPVLNNDNIQNTGKLSIKRNTHKYFYNEYVYKYNESISEDGKFLSGNILINQTSKNRIRAGNQPFLVESKGLRRSTATTQSVLRLQNRLNDRYQFGAGEIKGIELLYKDGFNIEVGDTVLYSSEDSQIPNLENGTRKLTPKLYEVVNRTFSFNKSVKIDILETSFLVNTRVGVFTPSSFTGATTSLTSIPLKLSFDTCEYDKDTDKWQEFVGEKIRIRSEDYSTYDETTTITGIDQNNTSNILVDALSSAPPENSIVEVILYDDTSADNESDYKLRFTYNGAQVVIDTVTDASNFTVLDATNLFIGASIQVHSEDYARDSFEDDSEIKILNIVGNAITLNSALDFIPISGDFVEQTVFGDEGFGYTYY